jgi:N-acetylglucosamine-6-phosphate deacetylase
MIKRIAKAPSETRGPIASPKVVLIKNATVWTCGPEGILTGVDVVFADGKCKGVGHDVKVQGEALVIDGAGKHVTPGLIDCHSHSAIVGSVNEGTLPSTAMVRIGDVVNSETRNIEEELAGGLTVANLLHGSANPIGGQNCVVKFRDGATPEQMKFDGAPEGIKFALGENVKQSNWGDSARTRFPQTRMGVPVFMRNRFQAARAYAEAMRSAPDKTRRDLELDAIVEIIEGKRLVHCHSYRQDEILAFLRTMEEFGVKVATLQHVLEGYKIADEIARHGAGASTFSDWFNYKYEVIDAIPYNGSLMRERGVVVSFNSDSSDLSRRLYTEAAKAVKYGATSEEEALKFVTINPAKQLRIDQRVGSLEPGKDADFVIWSKSPLDSGTVCLETWIDGKKYFDRAAVPAKMEALEKEREALLAKAKQAVGLKGAEKSEAAETKFFEMPLELEQEGKVRHCDDE